MSKLLARARLLRPGALGRGFPAASSSQVVASVNFASAAATGPTDMGAYKHNYETIIDQRAATAKHELATLAAAFMRYDGDGNGHLDRGELLEALSDLEVWTCAFF